MSGQKNNKPNLNIAIIGYMANFPGVNDGNSFWHNLKHGQESITALSSQELKQSGVQEEDFIKPNYVKAKGIINDVDKFAAQFFGYTAKEAELMDPQMKLLHEASWQALEMAGYNPYSYRGSIGIYVGAADNFYWKKIVSKIKDKPISNYETIFLTSKDFIATQLSFSLNLKGPAINVETACSTSLVAIHLASRALLMGECRMALAGGISISWPIKSGYLHDDGSLTSSDGHCRVFDVKAKGTVFSDGLGIIVLKRMEDALADGDNILAVIKGSAINNDGANKVSYSAPSVSGQAKVIKAAQQISGVSPETITYVEAHGTATKLGDLVEVEALTRAFATDKKQYCGLGSVKSNIGHTSTAAGVAGFIKTVLALQHKLIPASINYTKPNPKIDFKNSPFYVVTKPTPWKRLNPETPLRAGVSSFGIGGTNAHVILEEAPTPIPSDKGQDQQLLILSAKTETALEQMRLNLIKHLEANPNLNLADVAYTLQVGRAEFKYRKAVICNNNIKKALACLSQLDKDSESCVSDDILNVKKRNEASVKANAIIETIGKNNETQYVSLISLLSSLWLKGAKIDWIKLY
ncbi:MAG TPA: type I polyketide synthase, partial [Candidatus Portnoybacteria bacterium]|nr:type I polyketide synthase [Candidatus Portnoybacteria bacterium]